jgi:Zn-dependent peptidase ImmA (M78 family)
VTRELKAISGDSKISWRGIRIAMLTAANDLRKAAGEERLPVKLEHCKYLRRINSETRFQTGKTGIDAILVPTNQGFVLRLKEGQSRVRIRFSTAHEIGHTFFYDIKKTPPIRLVNSLMSNTFTRREEDICSAFAAELLMPRESVNKIIKSTKSTDGTGILMYLAFRYDVSPEVVARRLLHDLLLFPTTIILFSEAQYSDVGDIMTDLKKGYHGIEIKSLRKTERVIFNKVKAVIMGNPPYDKLDEIRDLYSDTVALKWRQDFHESGFRMIIWMEFLRN